MVVIGKWVIREACHQMVKWQTSANLNPAITMNINISGKQFINSRLCADITEILKETGLSAQNLKLEITENMFFENAEFSDQALEKLAKIGIQLQIDDFGSGYCSLGFLERHPINTIKLDRSFINKINAKDRRDIAGSIIKMALTWAWRLSPKG